MDMPGLETVQEELMCRVLGDMLEEDVVVKLPNDLYSCGDSYTIGKKSLRSKTLSN